MGMTGHPGFPTDASEMVRGEAASDPQTAPALARGWMPPIEPDVVYGASEDCMAGFKPYQRPECFRGISLFHAIEEKDNWMHQSEHFLTRDLTAQVEIQAVKASLDQVSCC